jgi:hypothetical protein
MRQQTVGSDSGCFEVFDRVPVLFGARFAWGWTDGDGDGGCGRGLMNERTASGCWWCVCETTAKSDDEGEVKGETGLDSVVCMC